MVDELNVNYRVGHISIGFHSDNVINEEIIRIMIKRYQNVYSIYVNNKDNLINSNIHDLIKQLVK